VGYGSFDKLSCREITEINFQILALQWLSLSKPPPLLAFSYGGFDASTSSATTGSTTTVIDKICREA